MKPLKKSFTLIELLVSIAIIGILSSLIIVAVNTFVMDARDGKRKVEINRIRVALWSASAMGTKGYPATPDLGSGSRAWCCLGTASTNCTNINTVIESLPLDPLYNTANQEWCYMYKSNGTTFDLYSKLEGEEAISLSPDSVEIANARTDCPANWVDTGLGFCVMKYEARSDGTTNCIDSAGSPAPCPVSQTSGTPWYPINQLNAIAACKSIGAHLVNNAEWMAMARDIENNSQNWSGGSPGSGFIPEGICEAGGPSDSSSPGTPGTLYYRILTLGNGSQVWDLSGNIHEWVDFTIFGAGSQPQVPFQTGALSWKEINSITNWGNTLGYSNVGPKRTNLNCGNGVGMILYDTQDTAVRGFVRGGYWSSGRWQAGLFALALYYAPDNAFGDGSGFRCAK
jgi:prepilin-type N-terminal cleavage/methylation domain-containing protein